MAPNLLYGILTGNCGQAQHRRPLKVTIGLGRGGESYGFCSRRPRYAMSAAYLFVYGTLRRGAETRMYRLLAQHSDFMGEAGWQGRLYKVDTYPGAVPSDNPAHRVRGEVYALREPAGILAALDVYEECGPGSAAPTEFVRTRQKVVLDNGERLMAWVYVYQRPTAGLTEIVSGDFLRPE